MTVYTKGATPGDFLVHHESSQANLFSAKLVMPATGEPHALTNVVGYPISYTAATRQALLLLTAAQANTVGFVLRGPAFSGLDDDAVTDELYTIVMGYNAVCNSGLIPAADINGGSFTLATITGAAGVAGFRFVTKPTKISTQVE